jgi:hypothetical protein
MTYIVTTQGGTRTTSIAACERRPHRCKACAWRQVVKLNAEDKAARQALTQKEKQK